MLGEPQTSEQPLDVAPIDLDHTAWVLGRGAFARTAAATAVPSIQTTGQIVTRDIRIFVEDVQDERDYPSPRMICAERLCGGLESRISL